MRFPQQAPIHIPIVCSTLLCACLTTRRQATKRTCQLIDLTHRLHPGLPLSTCRCHPHDTRSRRCRVVPQQPHLPLSTVPAFLNINDPLAFPSPPTFPLLTSRCRGRSPTLSASPHPGASGWAPSRSYFGRIPSPERIFRLRYTGPIGQRV
ncbi:hypothetical protein VUR80DRAFT_261 [Thermomyces stellatus]